QMTATSIARPRDGPHVRIETSPLRLVGPRLSTFSSRVPLDHAQRASKRCRAAGRSPLQHTACSRWTSRGRKQERKTQEPEKTTNRRAKDLWFHGGVRTIS